MIRKIEKLILNKFLLPVIYVLYSRKPIESGLVLFADSKHDELPVHMEGLYERLSREGYTAENWCVDFRHIGLNGKIKYLISFMKRYAVAEYVFICDYFVPTASCMKRPETKVIQLWHAGGMLKKFGYDAAENLKKLQVMDYNRNIDLWTVSAETCVAVFEQACHLYDGQVQPLGIVRTDAYHTEDYRLKCKNQFYKSYPELVGKKLVLWAPTFRSNVNKAELEGVDAILALEKQLGDDWSVLIKVHPHLAESYKINNCTIPTEELYPVIDLLITDYSSVVFDYCIFDKPFLIFAPDYDVYMKERGCYIDLEHEFPCPVYKSAEELSLAIRALSADHVKLKAFREKYMSACDGRSIERVLEYMRKNWSR